MKNFQKIALPALLASLMAGSAFAAEGLYSMDKLEDADVFDSTGKEIGEVENILMSNDMSVHSLVIETGEILGFGGREVVVQRGSFTVVPESGNKGFDDVKYKVHLEMTQDQLKQQPEYSKDWWNQTSASLQQTWQDTKQVSESAWENTKQAAASAWYELEEGAQDIGDDMDDATN